MNEYPWPPGIGPDTPLGKALDWVVSTYEQASGTRCPCCTQHAQVYWRNINTGMALSAIRLWRWHVAHGNKEFAHLPTVIGRRSAEEGKLAYWGLIEESGLLRDDRGRAGYWRLTDDGHLWVTCQTALPRYVRVYDGVPQGPPQTTSRSGRERPLVNVRTALGSKHDYDKLMRGEA